MPYKLPILVEFRRPITVLVGVEVWEGQWELIEGIPYAMSPTPMTLYYNRTCW